MFGNLTSRGIEPLGCFVYGWGWWPNNKALPREDWSYYYNFTRAFVTRYAIDVGFTPVLLELNYTNPAALHQPLAVLLEIAHAPAMMVLLVGLPAALVVGLLFLFKRIGSIYVISKKRPGGGAP